MIFKIIGIISKILFYWLHQTEKLMSFLPLSIPVLRSRLYMTSVQGQDNYLAS